MSIMKPLILKSVDFTKTQKSKTSLEPNIMFIEMNNSSITHHGVLYFKNSFAAELTFKKTK